MSFCQLAASFLNSTQAGEGPGCPSGLIFEAVVHMGMKKCYDSSGKARCHNMHRPASLILCGHGQPGLLNESGGEMAKACVVAPCQMSTYKYDA